MDVAQCHLASLIWCQSLLWTAASVIYDVPVAGGVARYDSGGGGHGTVALCHMATLPWCQSQPWTLVSDMKHTSYGSIKLIIVLHQFSLSLNTFFPGGIVITKFLYSGILLFSTSDN